MLGSVVFDGFKSSYLFETWPLRFIFILSWFSFGCFVYCLESGKK